MKNVRPTIASRSKSEPLPDDAEVVDESSSLGEDFKCAAVYWKETKGISLPENGKLRLLDDNTRLSFRGIFGTKIDCNLKQISVSRAARMGGMVRDAFRVVHYDFEKSEQDGVGVYDGSYLFTTVIKDHNVVMERIQSAINEAHAEKQPTVVFRRMPADDVLQKMTIIGKQKIKGVSMQDYFEVAWSEGNDCDKEPMYGPFLTSCGKNDVKVQKWESHEEGYKGEWCGETYSQERIVTFNFMKQTIGQTLVSVQHTQRCRRVDDDRCIVHMTLAMSGFSYSDCFVVEVRHVASHVGKNDILVEIGLYVRFSKSCLFEAKIKKNTSLETTKLQMDLLARVIKGCEPYASELTGVEEGEEEEDDDESDGIEGDSLMVSQKRDSGMTHKMYLRSMQERMLWWIEFMVSPILSMLLWPLIRLKLFDPLPPPKSTREALNNVRQRVVQLEKISSIYVPPSHKANVGKEIEAVNAALNRIEAIATSSKEG